MPPMIVDSHAHLDARMLDLDAMLVKMDGAGVDRVALIPSMNDPLPHTPERLLSAMRYAMQSGPGRLVAECVHRALMTREGNLKLSGAVYTIYPRPDNAGVAAAIEQHPDRFLGWIFLNPRDNPGVLDELEEWRHKPGMVGIKLHPHWHDYRVEILGPLFARAEELGLPILIHLGFRGRGDIRDLAQTYPRLKIIAAHAGFPFYQRLWGWSRAHANIYVDLSSPYIDESLARRAVAAMGPERCLYGTDSPYGFPAPDHTYDYTHIRQWIDRLPVTGAQKDAILGGNFVELTRCA